MSRVIIIKKEPAAPMVAANKKCRVGSQGFTLIELLVVVSIIGLLLTIATFAFSVVRLQARDAARAANIHTISRALALYLNDNGVYPEPAGGYGNGECLSAGGAGSSLVSAQTIINIPTDPLWPTTVPDTISNGYAVAPSSNFCYYYYATADNCYLSYFLEGNSKSGDAGIHVMTPAGPQN